MMKAHWWSCVLGLLCMPAEVILNTSTVSQKPFSINLIKVNSSADITCSTSLSDPMGLYLRRKFHGEGDIVYIALQNGMVTKSTTAAKFKDRIHINQDRQVRSGYGFTMRLSLLASDDTDLYYCTWSRFKPRTAIRESLSSNGTVIIVREEDPQGQCKDQIVLIMFCLCTTAFTVILFLFILVLILRYKQFKKNFRPARAVRPSKTSRTHHVCPQHRIPHQPYMVTSANILDFRDIL